MTLLRFSKFGQIGKKTRKGQRKSLFKELVVGKFTVARVTAKKTFFPLAIDVPPGYACRGVNKSHFFFSKIETVFLLR